MAEKRVAIRILFEKLDPKDLPALLEIIEELVAEAGGAEVEATILPSPPTVG